MLKGNSGLFSYAKQNLKIKADICPLLEKFSIASQTTFVIWALD